MKQDVFCALLTGLTGFLTTAWSGAAPSVAAPLFVPPCADTISCVGSHTFNVPHDPGGAVQSVAASNISQNTKTCSCYYGLSGTEPPVCTGYQCDYSVTYTITVALARSYQGANGNCNTTTSNGNGGGVATIVLNPASCGAMNWDDVSFYTTTNCYPEDTPSAIVHVEASCGPTLCPGNYCPPNP